MIDWLRFGFNKKNFIFKYMIDWNLGLIKKIYLLASYRVIRVLWSE
jgi:hypothetical protein